MELLEIKTKSECGRADGWSPSDPKRFRRRGRDCHRSRDHDRTTGPRLHGAAARGKKLFCPFLQIFPFRISRTVSFAFLRLAERFCHALFFRLNRSLRKSLCVAHKSVDRRKGKAKSVREPSPRRNLCLMAFISVATFRNLPKGQTSFLLG